MKYIGLLLPLLLISCATTDPVISAPKCTAIMQVPPKPEPKPPADAVFNKTALEWFVGSYQPAFKLNENQINSINEYCK